jgi:hypothetical protein
MTSASLDAVKTISREPTDGVDQVGEMEVSF